MADRILVARSKKVLFYGVPNTAGGSGTTIEYHRMKGFTDASTSKNSKEYTRQYVDELFEQTDVTGYSPSTSYGFDQYAGDAVHDDIVKITDEELIGNDAIRSLILVDLSAVEATAKTAPAVKRDYSVIPDSEGGSLDAYTYTGNFRSKGDKVKGTATTDDGWQTITFSDGSEDLE